jgi:hypothetical protein
MLHYGQDGGKEERGALYQVRHDPRVVAADAGHEQMC